jgi:hypothetical protein
MQTQDKNFNYKSKIQDVDVVKYFDIGLKLLTVFALLSVAFLGTKFVSRDEFKEANDVLSGRIGKIEEVLIRMEANYETDKRHDMLLADHESRIRTIEKTRSN